MPVKDIDWQKILKSKGMLYCLNRVLWKQASGDVNTPDGCKKVAKQIHTFLKFAANDPEYAKGLLEIKSDYWRG